MAGFYFNGDIFSGEIGGKEEKDAGSQSKRRKGKEKQTTNTETVMS